MGLWRRGPGRRGVHAERRRGEKKESRRVGEAERRRGGEAERRRTWAKRRATAFSELPTVDERSSAPCAEKAEKREERRRKGGEAQERESSAGNGGGRESQAAYCLHALRGIRCKRDTRSCCGGREVCAVRARGYRRDDARCCALTFRMGRHDWMPQCSQKKHRHKRYTPTRLTRT